MMMKSMRDATFKSDLLSSQSSEMYTAMHDQQVAQNIAGVVSSALPILSSASWAGE